MRGGGEDTANSLQFLREVNSQASLSAVREGGFAKGVNVGVRGVKAPHTLQGFVRALGLRVGVDGVAVSHDGANVDDVRRRRRCRPDAHGRGCCRRRCRWLRPSVAIGCGGRCRRPSVAARFVSSSRPLTTDDGP